MATKRLWYNPETDEWVESDIQIGTRVKCDSLRGIACYVAEWDKVWSEDGWEENSQGDQVYVIMVGDDQEHLVDFDDLTIIDEDEYCGQCGQIGCGHG